MSALDRLAACAGNWRGINTLQDPRTGTPELSPSEVTVTPVLGGGFVRIDYTWSDQGSPQEGSLLFGFDPNADEVSGHWIDTWHMGRKGMACVGTTPTEGKLSVVGSYAAPPGPDWGWRIEVAPEAEALRITHTNIDLEGNEMPAAEGVYSRA